MPATDYKDKRVKAAISAALEQGTHCKAAFNSILFGMETAEDIALTQCPALRVGFENIRHNRERVAQAHEQVIATYRGFIIVKNPQASDAEDQLLDLLNAVRLDLHADTSLGGLSLDLTSEEAARDHVVAGDEVIDVIELTILVAYVKNPVTGL